MILKFLNKNKIYIKFIFSGSIATTNDLFFLYLFHGILKIHLVYAVLLAYSIAFIISFSLQKYWTFSENAKNSNNSVHKQLAMYIIISSLNVFLNSLFVHFLVKYQYIILNNYFQKLFIVKNNIWYLIAQAVVCGILGIESFLVYKYVIFKKKIKIVEKNDIDNNTNTNETNR